MDLGTFTEEFLNGKLHFLCTVITACRFNSMCNESIFYKPFQIKWREPTKFRCCVSMGMFHMIMIMFLYTQILLKRVDGSLQHALVQKTVVEKGSVIVTLRGKCNNRGIRLYNLFYEALFRIIINLLAEEFVQNKEGCLTEITSSEFDKMLYGNIKESEKLKKFINISNSGSVELRKFWLSFIYMTDLLLLIISVVRHASK